jgi:hypothetical protein
MPWVRYNPSIVLWNYLARSSGHILWCLLTLFDWSNISLISWLLWPVACSLYLLAWSVISSGRNWILMSLWNVRFKTKQGAPLIILRVSDWYVWSIFVLDGLLHPHNSTPYVQTGLSIVSYMVNLFSTQSFDFLFFSQYQFSSFSSSWRLLALMWFFQVNFLSRCRPRAFWKVASVVEVAEASSGFGAICS